jgi:hypothetical protein
LVIGPVNIATGYFLFEDRNGILDGEQVSGGLGFFEKSRQYAKVAIHNTFPMLLSKVINGVLAALGL